MTLKYDIEVVSLHGLDPEGEPSPEDIAEVIDHINEEGITVLFIEEFTDQGAVDSIVQQTGVSIQILYTMEMSPSDANDNYLSLMNKNLENLISGIGC
jgi:zinc transport system substrate-binding protein